VGVVSEVDSLAWIRYQHKQSVCIGLGALDGVQSQGEGKVKGEGEAKSGVISNHCMVA
jgi:hypothetical protein